MDEPRLFQLLQLRLAVGFLGEKQHYGWWQTAFFEDTSRQFLEPVFIKSTRQAQYHGVLEAARRVHDEHLSSGSFHLFRLPEEIEQDLFSIARSRASTDAASFIPNDKEQALSTLQSFPAGGSGPAQGPTLLGNISELGRPETVGVMARTYFSAFTSSSRVYPYFVGKQ